MTEPTAIPNDIAFDICEDSLIACPANWPKFNDCDGDIWWLTDYTHGGDHVMLPAPGDTPLMLRCDVERLYGPLKPTAAVPAP